MRRRLLAHTVAFLLGLSVVFVALGYGAGAVGEALFRYGDAVRLVAGGLLIGMGLFTLGVVPIPALQREVRGRFARHPGGYAGSALVGVAFAAGWTPCIGPVLAGILALAGSSGNGGGGGLLLAAYALGFSVPFVLAAQALPAWRGLSRHTRLLERIGGVLLVALGLLLLFDGLGRFAPYLAALGSLESVLPGAAAPGLGVALLAGALSFLSPCVLPILPALLAYLTGLTADELAAGASSR